MFIISIAFKIFFDNTEPSKNWKIKIEQVSRLHWILDTQNMEYFRDTFIFKCDSLFIFSLVFEAKIHVPKWKLEDTYLVISVLLTLQESLYNFL